MNVKVTGMPEALKNRTGVAKYLGDILDSTKSITDDLTDYMGDMLDSTDKLQQGVQKSARKVLRADRDSDV
jgi:hypothetical protein